MIVVSRMEAVYGARMLSYIIFIGLLDGMHIGGVCSQVVPKGSTTWMAFFQLLLQASCTTEEICRRGCGQLLLIQGNIYLACEREIFGRGKQQDLQFMSMHHCLTPPTGAAKQSS